MLVTLEGINKRKESVSQQNNKTESAVSLARFFLLCIYLLSKSNVQTLYFNFREFVLLYVITASPQLVTVLMNSDFFTMILHYY